MERFRTKVDLEHFYSHVTKLGLFNSSWYVLIVLILCAAEFV